MNALHPRDESLLACMNPDSPARGRLLARAARRNAEGGAIMFILAMTLAVLAAVGMYALNGASYEVRTAGFSRQSTQTHYLADYGAMGAAQMVNADTATMVVNIMIASRDEQCRSVPSLTEIPLFARSAASPEAGRAFACRRVGSKEMANNGGSAGGAGGWATTAFTSTPFGPVSQVGADFVVELSDPVQMRPPPGVDLKGGLCYMQMTANSIGLTQPLTSANAVVQYGNTGTETTRTRMTVGPVRCTN